MKYIVGCILFLLLACSWWNGGDECTLLEASEVECVGNNVKESERHSDNVVNVLKAANSCADLSERPHNSFFSQMARRYRTLGSSWAKIFENLVNGQSTDQHITFKITAVLAAECDARLKNAGYYIYTLRKIII